MKIDYQAQLCTAFLAVRTSADDKGASFAPMATAFFIGESLSEDRAIKYIVTARHVIDLARPHGSLWMRCISPDGERKAMYEFPVDAWWAHPTTDVAVAPLAIALEEFDLRWLPLIFFCNGGLAAGTGCWYWRPHCGVRTIFPVSRKISR